MEDKFKTYYSLIDCYNKDISNYSYYEDSEPFEEILFKEFPPINTSIIMRYVTYIVNDICKELNSKEEAIKEIENLKKSINRGNDIKNFQKYQWKNTTLIDLLIGDYNLLKNIFVIEDKYVPDINYFINNYKYPDDDISYNFSLKELCYKLIERGIIIAINNYYYKK